MSGADGNVRFDERLLRLTLPSHSPRSRRPSPRPHLRDLGVVVALLRLCARFVPTTTPRSRRGRGLLLFPLGSGILCGMAYPSEDRPASPPGAAESLTPGSPAYPGTPEPLMPRPPGSSLDARRDEPGGASLEATDGSSRPIGDEAATDTRREPVKLTPTRTSAM